MTEKAKKSDEEVAKFLQKNANADGANVDGVEPGAFKKEMIEARKGGKRKTQDCQKFEAPYFNYNSLFIVFML